MVSQSNVEYLSKCLKSSAAVRSCIDTCLLMGDRYVRSGSFSVFLIKKCQLTIEAHVNRLVFIF